MRKGTTKYTDPMLIQEKIGPGTDVLGDGKKWNASHLAIYPETGITPVTERNERNETVTNPARS